MFKFSRDESIIPPEEGVNIQFNNSDASEISSVDHEQQQDEDRKATTLPLSMKFLKYTHCMECARQEESVLQTTEFQELALQFNTLKRQRSVISPFVRTPMMHSISDMKSVEAIQHVLRDYMAACQLYGCPPNAGVLTCVRFQTPSLRVSGSFHDADMLALAEIFFKYPTILRFIKRLDFSRGSKEGKMHGKTGFRSHGALTLSKVLQQSMVEEVYLQRNKIGPYGASAIFLASLNNPSIRKLVLRRCAVGERGALALAEIIRTNPTCELDELDLSANGIGFRGCVAIEDALNKQPIMQRMTVDLEGNLVFQEVMSGITHGLGMIVAFIGASLLSARVRDMPFGHVASCSVYSTSLIVLYMSSTLYHSFFTLQNTKYIFEVLDKCAIYILIAGSYTPFLRIVVADRKIWSVYLLAFIWSCCILGITVEASFPAWRYRTLFSLAMYLFMGWSSLIALPEISTLLPDDCIKLMVLGGCTYTAGVPFFVRNNNLDHAIWHLFVLAGSAFHWCGVYFYVARYTRLLECESVDEVIQAVNDSGYLSSWISWTPWNLTTY